MIPDCISIVIANTLIIYEVVLIRQGLAAFTSQATRLWPGAAFLMLCGWQPIESYISHRSEAKFTHGICPDCLHKHYPDVASPILKK